MSSPRGIGGSAREGTRVVLKEITATLHNSPPIHSPRRKSDNETSVPKTAEHEVKVRFTREFADVELVTENLCPTPESLSSISSFHSLSTTLSTKSSSGICPDLTSETPDDLANTSYVNSNIPGVEDLTVVCVEDQFHLETEQDTQDFNQDLIFTSATDEEIFLPDNISNETQVIETNPQLHETTYVSLNETHTFWPSDSTLPVQDSQLVIQHLLPEEHIPQEKSNEQHILLQESDNTVNEFETYNIISSIAKDSSPSNVDNNQLNVTTVISSEHSIPNVVTLKEEQTVENSAETLLVENSELCSIEVFVPFISSSAQCAKELSLSDISNTSLLLEDTNSKTKKNSIHDSTESAQDVSSTALLSSDNTDQKLCILSQVIVNNHVVEAELSNDIITKQNLTELDNRVVSNHEEDSTQLLNKTNIIESKVLDVRENLQTNANKKASEIKNNEVLNEWGVETQNFLPGEEIVCNKISVTEECNPLETVIIEKEENVKSAALSDTVKEKATSIEEDLDRTLTLQETDINFMPDEEFYEEFKPQRQSTTLSLMNEQQNFEELKPTPEEITNQVLSPTLKLLEETDQFVSATSEIFKDPSTFDFLLAQNNSRHTNRLRTESLYVKFDPLISNTSMLPQGNNESTNDEQNGKNESPLPNVDTPKRNPAIAAIDRLLFYSPLPSGTMQKLEEAQEKNEQPVENSKSDTSLITDHIDMSKELELVRTTLLQLEEEFEKQKKEHAEELEKQKVAFEEKINKLQTQIAQEVKTKTQMTVVVGEYEKSISRSLTERERDRTNFEQEKAKLQEELQAANHHLTNTEAAFNDVHQKYERLKGVVSVYKNNETVLKESIQENVETIKALETRYDQLKEHAMIQLEKANLELDGIRKQHETETVKLHAMIRKAELKSNSLAELVEQKTKENKELTKILDEVIARVGHGNSD